MTSNPLHDWTQTPEGYSRESEATGEPVTSSIRMHAGHWRLARRESWRDPSEALDLFESPSIDACMHYDRHLDTYGAGKAAWLASSFSDSYPTHVEGLTVDVGKRAGSNSARAYLINERRHTVGSYRFNLNNEKAAYVAGGMTISGASSVNDDYRNKGLGLALYDAACKVSGMQCVPHGSDFVRGALSRFSTAFWEKRARHQGLPITTPEALARKAELVAGIAIPDYEVANKDSKAFMVALADITGGQLEGTVAIAPDGVEYFGGLWVRLPHGALMDELGVMDRQRTAQVQQEASDGHQVVRSGMLSTEDACAVELAWRESQGGWVYESDVLVNDMLSRLPAVEAILRRHLADHRLATMPGFRTGRVTLSDTVLEQAIGVAIPETEAAPAP